MVPAVRPLGSPSMARGCARIDSGPDTAKKAQPIASRSITPGYLQLLGYQKTFPHGLDPKRTYASSAPVSFFSSSGLWYRQPV